METRIPVEEAIIGFTVLGRHGQLGVVDSVEERPDGSHGLVVIGGRTALLRFLLPWSRISEYSISGRILVADLDVVDFAPRTGQDGCVELHYE